MVYINDDGHVVVDWVPHGRLDRAAIEMVDADRPDAEAVVRYDVVRAAMHTALETILQGFRYTIRRSQFGFGRRRSSTGSSSTK
ncbi:hypothetical protein ABZ341_34600 [Streptomyces sp. NPDC006173]|uniref:hypothetical protein n=1 Tax=Streptomyces sp. NPDC006173 TaxID=3155349 RepID=UPI0033D4ED9A